MVDGLFYFCIWISIFFFALISGILTYSSIRYRRKSPSQPAASSVTHNTTLEVVWTLIPTIIVFVIFAWGWKGNLEQSVAPANALQYRLTAQQWSWSIYHPGAISPSAEMWVPLDTPVKITMDSKDVIHSFFIPAFRVKRDVLPGRYQLIWFEANVLGDFDLFCAEYCGKDHSRMHSKVHVVSQEDYDKKPWDKHPEDPIAWGKELYQVRCFACHSTDGSVKIGPSWKGIWGEQQEVTEDGKTVTVAIDRDYIRESIYEPQKKIVKDFEVAKRGAMTTFSRTEIPDAPEGECELDAIIAFIKSLK